MLGGQVEQLLDNGADFPGKLAAAGKCRVFLAEHPTAQCLATIAVRRTPLGIVPGRSPPVADLRRAFVPGPQFDQGVHPEVQMPGPDVRPEVTDLLLSGSPHLFEVVEVLFDRRPVGEDLQNLLHGDLRVEREEELAAGRLLDNDHPDHAVGRTVGRQEGLDLFADHFAVLDALDPEPAPGLPGAFGQADPLCAVFAGLATAAALAFFEGRRQCPEGGVLAGAG